MQYNNVKYYCLYILTVDLSTGELEGVGWGGASS